MSILMEQSSLMKNDWQLITRMNVYCYLISFTTIVDQVIVIHNNYIVGVAGKEYRFKELMLYNENVDEYYGNQEEKFIWFETNPFFPPSMNTFSIFII